MLDRLRFEELVDTRLASGALVRHLLVGLVLGVRELCLERRERGRVRGAVLLHLALDGRDPVVLGDLEHRHDDGDGRGDGGDRDAQSQARMPVDPLAQLRTSAAVRRLHQALTADLPP